MRFQVFVFHSSNDEVRIRISVGHACMIVGLLILMPSILLSAVLSRDPGFLQQSEAQTKHEDSEGCFDSLAFSRFPGSLILGCLNDPQKQITVSLSQTREGTFIQKSIVGDGHSWNYLIPEDTSETVVFDYLKKSLEAGGFIITYAHSPSDITAEGRSTWVVLQINKTYYNQNIVSATNPASISTLAEKADSEGLVRLALTQTTRDLYDTLIQNRLSILGDASSMALTKVLAGKNLSADDIDRVLAVISFSFDMPTAIQEPSDCNPRTTMFVLKYLDSLTNDATLKKKIVDTKNWVESVGKSL